MGHAQVSARRGGEEPAPRRWRWVPRHQPPLPSDPCTCPPRAQGPEPRPPPRLTRTFQQGLQDGHVHVLLAVLALPEDGQQLPPPDNVLDLQRTAPVRRGSRRASGDEGDPMRGPRPAPPPALSPPPTGTRDPRTSEQNCRTAGPLGSSVLTAMRVPGPKVVPWRGAPHAQSSLAHLVL